MKRRVVWSHGARHDYLSIIRHVAAENPDAAGRIAGQFAAVAAALGDFATGRQGRVQDTYEKVVIGLPYILAYEIVRRPEGGETVAILHLIHTSRDWPEEDWPQP